MNKIFHSVLLLTLVAGCSVNKKQIHEAIKADPELIFSAIEERPERFMEVVRKAAQIAENKAQLEAAEMEKKRFADEFKNPLKPQVNPGRVIFGNKNAPITIVEYSDFECPFCSRGFETIQQVKKHYGDKVRVIYKHLPLSFHPQAMPSARYFEAVARQSPEKAEKFHDIIFSNQQRLTKEGVSFLREAAKSLGLNLKTIDKDLADKDLMKNIEADVLEAGQFQITGTPGFIINGVSLRGAYPFDNFKSIIDQHLAAGQ
ncbi:MAG: thioredoxin domain-containing protein [Bacteriovoracaceae bacterium]|nr:thioredoxin domain-containing protein [Bacteriovoracaceae bacterium]